MIHQFTILELLRLGRGVPLVALPLRAERVLAPGVLLRRPLWHLQLVGVLARAPVPNQRRP